MQRAGIVGRRHAYLSIDLKGTVKVAFLTFGLLKAQKISVHGMLEKKPVMQLWELPEFSMSTPICRWYFD